MKSPEEILRSAGTIAVVGAVRIAATAAEILGLTFIAWLPEALVGYSPLERRHAIPGDSPDEVYTIRPPGA